LAGGSESHAFAEPYGESPIEDVAGCGGVHGLDRRCREVAGFTVTYQNTTLIAQLHDNDGRTSASQLAADANGLNRIKPSRWQVRQNRGFRLVRCQHIHQREEFI
jgi:hypothetical protein